MTQAKHIIESLLFSSSEPLTIRKIQQVLGEEYPLNQKEIREFLSTLAAEYEDRAFTLEEIGNGYLLRTRQEFGPYIHKLLKSNRPEKLSQAAAEVLAIIAYRQPITRPQIEDIRGIDSSGIIQTLLEKELIEPAGKLEVPGRPTLYGVTQYFLKHFGLKSVNDLPAIERVSTKL